jgi:hypothetical protein
MTTQPETHLQRMTRLGEKCNAAHVTFGGRCLNCGYTPPDHKATLFSPRLDATWEAKS